MDLYHKNKRTRPQRQKNIKARKEMGEDNDR